MLKLDCMISQHFGDKSQAALARRSPPKADEVCSSFVKALGRVTDLESKLLSGFSDEGSGGGCRKSAHGSGISSIEVKLGSLSASAVEDFQGKSSSIGLFWIRLALEGRFVQLTPIIQNALCAGDFSEQHPPCSLDLRLFIEIQAPLVCRFFELVVALPEQSEGMLLYLLARSPDLSLWK